LSEWLVYQEQPFATSTTGRVELIRTCRRIDPATVATAHLLLADLPVVALTGWV
jgi:hypothetical protein